MTDKVRKIREEVERLKSNLIHGACSSQIAMETRCKEEAYNDVFAILDTMQEEPKTDWLQELKEKLNSLSKEEFKELRAKYKLREEDSVNYDKLNTMLDESLSKETKESWKKRLGEEPVSKDLEEAAQEYTEKGSKCQEELDAFKAGAKWKAEQFEKNRLKHCNSISNEQAELEQGFIDQHLDKYNRMPTFLDAIEYGMNLQKEQMIAKAIDASCFGFQSAALFSFRLPADKYLVGSKVKVIVVKED